MIVFNLYVLPVVAIAFVVGFSVEQAGWVSNPFLSLTMLVLDLALRGWNRPGAFRRSLVDPAAGGTIFWIVPLWAVGCIGLSGWLGLEGAGAGAVGLMLIGLCVFSYTGAEGPENVPPRSFPVVVDVPPWEERSANRPARAAPPPPPPSGRLIGKRSDAEGRP